MLLLDLFSNYWPVRGPRPPVCSKGSLEVRLSYTSQDLISTIFTTMASPEQAKHCIIKKFVFFFIVMCDEDALFLGIRPWKRRRQERRIVCHHQPCAIDQIRWRVSGKQFFMSRHQLLLDPHYDWNHCAHAHRHDDLHIPLMAPQVWLLDLFIWNRFGCSYHASRVTTPIMASFWIHMCLCHRH